MYMFRYNRPHFEEQAQEILRRPDLLDLSEYYTRSPSSGLWILEFGEKFVGLLALDASLDSMSVKTFSSNGNASQTAALRKQLSKKGTSAVATIRHFYIMEEYRPALIQEDLLEYAVSQAFSKDPKVKAIKAVDSDFEKWKAAALTKEGFVVEKELKRVGLLRWKIRSRELTRERWEQVQQQRVKS
jgi:hypothetical protein